MNTWKITQQSEVTIHLDGVEDWTEDVWADATARFDGCVTVSLYFNAPRGEAGGDCDSIHICRLDDFIARLQKLREIATAAFPNQEAWAIPTR